MWKCIRCHIGTSFADAESGIDDFGIYFICPHCSRRKRPGGADADRRLRSSQRPLEIIMRAAVELAAGGFLANALHTCPTRSYR
jgi:hypothetical protein